MTVRIVHAADFHLGRAFPQLGERAPVRTEDLFDTFARVCEVAIRHEVAALLLAGDVFDTFSPDSEALARVRHQFDRLQEAGVRVFIVPGDADSAMYERSVWRRETFAGVHVFLAATFEVQSFEVEDTAVHIHGVAFNPSVSREPMDTLQCNGPGIHIVTAHATIDVAGKDSNSYFPVPGPRLLQSGAAYVALGHEHERRQVPGPDGMTMCYPGSPEGLRQGETGPRYAALVEFDTDNVPEVSFLPVNGRQIATMEIDVTDLDTSDVLHSVLDAGDDDTLLTLHLSGAPREMLDLDALRRVLSDAFFSVQIVDDTILASSSFAAAIADENSVPGYFVRALQRRIKGARDAEEREALERALKLGLRALERSTAA